MKKYPRTFHLSFSPEIHSDDKVCDMCDVSKLIEDGTPVVITEKLDGGNCCLSADGVFARSHSEETKCPTFNYIKNVHFYPKMNNFTNKKIFGENMFAIHSIKYTNLKDYFYVFNILEASDVGYNTDKSKMSDRYISWDDLISYCNQMDYKPVPLVYEGKIKSLKWLETFLADELKKPSALGGEREGFVIRVRKSFDKSQFSKKVFKYVRAGHVQTDEHWSKNWVQAPMNKD